MNLTEIEAIITYVEDHPEEWRQTEWAVRTECGTAYCMAGHAVVRAGYHVPLVGQNVGSCSCEKGGQWELISIAAAQVLELDHDEALTLFACSNTLDDLKLIVKAWSNGQQVERVIDLDEVGGYVDSRMVIV